MVQQLENLSSAEIPTPLNDEENIRLRQLEGVIEKSLQSFLVVGRCLIEVRDRKLYRARYSNFQAYCTQRWGISERRGLDLVRATAVAENLLAGPAAPGGDAPLPEGLSDQTLRPLTKLQPELQSACWRLASRISERPSGHTVRSVVNAVEGAIAQANGSHAVAPGEEAKKPKEVFLPSLYKLAQGESFSAQLIVMRVDETQAQKLATACRILGERCEAIQLALIRQFPHVCFGNLCSDQTSQDQPVSAPSVR